MIILDEMVSSRMIILDETKHSSEHFGTGVADGNELLYGRLCNKPRRVTHSTISK